MADEKNVGEKICSIIEEEEEEEEEDELVLFFDLASLFV